MWIVHPVQNAECFDLVGPAPRGFWGVVRDYRCLGLTRWASSLSPPPSSPQSAATCLSFILFRSRLPVPSMQGLLFQSSAVQHAEYPIKS